MVENPPAFPFPEVRIDGMGIRKGSDGMGLRDWFASCALAGFIANPSRNSAKPTLYAADAYRAADAMLAERAKAEGRDHG